ncbi:MAG: tRNA (adenine-N(6)-)-methyltransferase [Candidatus Cryptobacteroides sp.]
MDEKTDSMSQRILYSKGNNDECYTPAYVVKEIMAFLPKDKIIWCPFDDDQSEFVKVLKQNGYFVINTHIDYGQDFFDFEPEHWDIMVSNPPFTNKRKIFERALSFNKPFALLMSNTWLNDSAPKVLFKEKDLQLLMFRNRIKFLNNGIINNKITFSSSFFCWNLLPKQIVISDK